MISLLLPIVTLGVTCAVLPTPENPDDYCPQVYRVQGEGLPPSGAFPILFVPDGFDADQIHQFRCAVRRLVEGIVSSPPFAEVACHLSFYRMDLALPGPKLPSEFPTGEGCEGCAGAGDDPNWPSFCDAALDIGDPIYETEVECALPPVEWRFNSALCTSEICRLIWPDDNGQDNILEYSACVPDGAKAVIIVANTYVSGGGGRETGDVRLVVTSLADIDTPGRWWLLAHELGHALFGLLDEYDQELQGFDYLPGRNVATQAEAVAGNFLWKEKCTVEDCDAVCNTLVPNMEPDLVSLVPGAFYHSDCYYRSQPNCRMRSNSEEFCEACRLYANEFLDKHGLDLCESTDE